jgi:general secretion pathway protein D
MNVPCAKSRDFVNMRLLAAGIIGFLLFFAPDVYAQAVAVSAPPEAAESNFLQKSSDNKWVVNFKDADIQSVIGQVARITGDNYIISPNVNGKVNVISQAPLTKSELKELLLSVLYINGFTAVTSGASIVIEPNADARKNNIIIDKSGKTKGAAFVARVIPLKFANITDLMQALPPLVSDFAVLKSLPDSNAILVVDKADNVQKVAEIVAELDYPETDEMESVKLKNSWVGNIMPLLDKLAPRELGSPDKPVSSSIRVVGDEHNNIIMLKGDRVLRMRLRALIERLDQPSEDDATVQVIQLQNIDAAKTVETLKDMFNNNAAAMGHSGVYPIPVSIKANVSSNALVVHGPPEVISSIRKVVAQLDVQRTQILIEAAIVEINGDLLNQLGIQFGSGQAAFEAGAVATSLPGGGTSSLAAPIVGLASYLQGVGASNSGLLGSGLTATLSSHSNFVALVSALASDSRANLLSTPSITTVNNEEAKIVVGQNVPFRTGSFDTSTATTTGVVNPFTTIQRQDVGITLKVTPQVNENNRIFLKVSQEVSSIQPTTLAGAADIITNKRTIDTTVLAMDGQTIALGGLISNNKTQNKTKVPILGDIPYLGLLFQSNSEETVKSDLVIFLRPTVIANNSDIEGTNLRKYNGLWELDIGAKPKYPLQNPAELRSRLDKLYEPDLTGNSGPLPWQSGQQDTPLPWLKGKK